MRKLKKALASLAIAGMVLSMAPASVFAADSDRIEGKDRYETAIKIAEKAYSEATTAVVAAGNPNNLVDALAVAPLAAQEKAPIYLTNVKDKVDVEKELLDSLDKLGVEKVFAVGAAGKDKATVDALEKAGYEVEVLAGNSRIETAEAINAKLVDPKGTIVVGLLGEADAMSVASFAAVNKYQIVIAKGDGTTTAKDVDYIVGGEARVKDIDGATRLSGNDRYETNLDVISKLSFDFDTVYVANGRTLADALVASVLAAQTNSPILLANDKDNSVKAASYVNENLTADSKVIALGGTSSVSNSALAKVGYNPTGVETVAVTAADYDDDTNNQYVAFTVNGKKSDVQALVEDGWDVEFTAYTDKAGTAEDAAFFADKSTGLISVPATVGDYYIQIVLTKGADIVASELQKISIKNLNVSVSGIDSYDMTNDNGTVTGGSPFTQESNTLVVGETVTVDSITTVVGGNKFEVDDGYTLKTSNAGVISVDNTTASFKAENPGTATLTIAYGKATKNINFKVVTDEREINKVRVKQGSSVITSLKVVKGLDTTVKVEALDQYGDPFVDVSTVESTNTSVIKEADLTWTAPNLKITASAQGSTTLNFFDSNNKKIGSLSVTVSGSTSVAKKALELWTPSSNGQAASVVTDAVKSEFSKDNTVDLSSDKYVVYHVMQYNADNLKLGAVADTDLTVSVTDTDILGFTKNDDGKVVIEGKKPGTATVQIKDNTAGGKTYTQKITVVDTSYTVKSVSFKSIASPQYATTYTYRSVLNVTLTANDPILSGVNLNKATPYELRIDPTNGTIYIDVDANGSYNSSNDTKVGEFQIVDVDGTVVTSVNTGVSVTAGDEGTIIFRVVDNNGKVVAWTSVKVDL